MILDDIGQSSIFMHFADDFQGKPLDSGFTSHFLCFQCHFLALWAISFEPQHPTFLKERPAWPHGLTRDDLGIPPSLRHPASDWKLHEKLHAMSPNFSPRYHRWPLRGSLRSPSKVHEGVELRGSQNIWSLDLVTIQKLRLSLVLST